MGSELDIDLQRFHSEEGRQYLIVYTILGVVTVVDNAVLGQQAERSHQLLWTRQQKRGGTVSAGRFLGCVFRDNTQSVGRCHDVSSVLFGDR